MTAIMTAIITAIATLLGVFMTQWRANVTEEKRHQRDTMIEIRKHDWEIEAEHIRWNREQAARLRSERLAAYSRLVELINLSWPPSHEKPNLLSDLVNAASFAELLASDAVRPMIRKMMDSALDHAELEYPSLRENQRHDEAFSAALGEYWRRHDEISKQAGAAETEFLDAVRNELDFVTSLQHRPVRERPQSLQKVVIKP